MNLDCPSGLVLVGVCECNYWTVSGLVTCWSTFLLVVMSCLSCTRVLITLEILYPMLMLSVRSNGESDNQDRIRLNYYVY